ncbi:terminase [Actinomyces sp. 432]|nr:terminase [Actinomyces sp. 432]
MRRAHEECPLRIPGATRFGRSTPRVCTPAARELTPDTSYGYSLIEFAHDVLGMRLLPWEQELAIRALEVDAAGARLRYRTVLLLVARQNGKSTFAQVLSLWAMYVLGIGLLIGTAQDLDIAEELWSGCVDIAESVDELAAAVTNVNRTNGKKALEIDYGGAKSKYKVKASSRKGARGLSGDLIILDELREHTNWDAWGAVTKTTIARPKAQTWTLSNAGDDASVVLMTLRRKAHAGLGDPDGVNADETVVTMGGGEDSGIGLFEWSAAPGRATSDRDGWAEANPSLGYTIAEGSLASAEATDPEPVFRTECLCQWVTTMREGPFPDGVWDACTDPVGVIPDEAPVTYAVDVSVDRSAAYVAAAGVRADGRPQVEIVAARPGQGWADWLPEWFRGFVDEDYPARVVVQAKACPASVLVDVLAEVDGLTVVPWQGGDLGIGCGLLYDRVLAASPDASERIPPLAHRGQEALNLAAHTAAQRYYGDGWYWDRRNSPQDAAPLIAATEALWDLLTNAPESPSVYEDGPLPLS